MMKVGIVGGGQLARLLVLAGYNLGLQFQILDPAIDACAGQLAYLIKGNYEDISRLKQLAEWADVVTFDFENVPATAARILEEQVAVYPQAQTLYIAQDRFCEKTLFLELGIPTTLFATVDSLDELRRAVIKLDLPAVLKTRRLGYDGKGQRVLRILDDVESAWQELGGVPLILEELVPFEREVSVLAVRGIDGETKFYPLVENYHRDGILRLSRVPCRDQMLEFQGYNYTRCVLDHLNYIGLLAVEFFVKKGCLIANEIAPRVHNSGHWTIDGAETSQFENHLRAILGLPLGSTSLLGPCIMLNCIGAMPELARVLAVQDTHYHFYGKTRRFGRKVGHLTLRVNDSDKLRACLNVLLPLVGLTIDEFLEWSY